MAFNMKWVLWLICLYVASHSLRANKCPKNTHGDIYRCPPCNCSHTYGGKIIADCSSPRIQSLPQHLPPSLWSLTITKTNITTLDTQDFIQYSNLNVLTISKNVNLTHIRNSSVLNQTTQISEVDFSWNNITFIAERSFAVMPLTRNLSLQHNNIKKISNSTFEGLHLLIQLDLSTNNITSIEHGAFRYMTHLKTLILSRNRHLGYGTQQLSPLLFVNLKALHTLFIQSSSNDAREYPNEALQQLDNLEKLVIDGLRYGDEFSPKIKSLKHLKHLQLGCMNSGPECNIRNITANFFDNLPYLESFKVERCRLKHLNQTALTKLKFLKKYTIIMMPFYDLYWAFEDLEGLVNSKVTSLSLVSLHVVRTLCRYLGPKHAKYLQKMPLQELDLSFNRLASIDTGFTRLLPTTLQRLDLTGNKLTMANDIMQKIAHLNDLVGLRIGNQDVNYGFSSGRNTDSSYVCKNITNEMEEPSEKTLFWQKPYFYYTNAQDTQETDRLQIDTTNRDYNFFDEVDIDEEMFLANQGNYQHKKKTNWLTLPKKLHTISAYHFKRFGYLIFTFNLCPKNNSLREIAFDNSFLTGWGSGKMPPGITKANLDGNYCQHIKRDFFQPNNSLVHLSLQNNYLGYDFERDSNGSIFAELSKTVYLDLSRNLIFSLHRPFFKGLVSLRTLKLSDNKLQVLNTSFSHMKDLAFLDLSKNSIIWISRTVRQDLDIIASRPGHGLKIDLTDNQLPCTCDGLEILNWMANSNICFLNSEFLECRLDNGEKEIIGNLSVRFHSLQRHCVSKDMIIVICVASILFVGGFVILGLLYRNRWRIRYWRHITMAKMFGFKPRENGMGAYKFDAYILYTDETTKFVRRECVQELEEKRGHKLCIEDREYLPGTDILGSIVSAVQNSRKAIPIVTPEFYDNDFSEFRIKMAMMEEVYKSRSVLHLCIYQPVPEDEMSEDFLTVMRRNCFIEFPPPEEVSEEIRQNFWDQLSQVIGHQDEEPDM